MSALLGMQSMLPALEAHALRGELAERKAALLGLEALGRHAVLLDMAAFEGTIPRLLTCCCNPSREVGISRDHQMRKQVCCGPGLARCHVRGQQLVRHQACKLPGRSSVLAGRAVAGLQAFCCGTSCGVW